MQENKPKEIQKEIGRYKLRIMEKLSLSPERIRSAKTQGSFFGMTKKTDNPSIRKDEAQLTLKTKQMD